MTDPEDTPIAMVLPLKDVNLMLKAQCLHGNFSPEGSRNEGLATLLEDIITTARMGADLDMVPTVVWQSPPEDDYPEKHNERLCVSFDYCKCPCKTCTAE